MITTTSIGRLTATVLGAIAIGGAGFLAPVAHAQPPKSEAQRECSDPEAGGDYSSSTDSAGNKIEKCCYEGLSGVIHCDVWVNGKWDDGLSSHQEPTTPPSRPGAPPIAGGTPEMSPDASNPPTKTPKGVLTGQLPVTTAQR